MKKLFAILCALTILPSVFANVIVTEIMYNPSPVSDTEGEWVELYNNGTTAIDLSSWTLNSAHLSNTLQPGQYMVVARKLVGNNSFESTYGNNDGVWNDGFAAVQATMSLVDEGTITLTNSEGIQEFLNYSSSWGGKNNGNSLYRRDINLPNTAENWGESVILGGTPGRSEDSTLHVSFMVEPSQISIVNKTFSDDLPQGGFQLIPSPGSDRQVMLGIKLASALNASGSLTFQNATIPLVANGTDLSAQVSIPFSLQAGNYSVSIHVVDGSKFVDEVITFEVMPLLALQTSTSILDFGAITQNQTSSEKVVTLRNTGNTVVNAALSASNFTSGSTALAPGVISVTTDAQTTSLDYTTNLALNLTPGSSKDISFVANIPGSAPAGEYVGAVSVVGRP